MPETIAIAELLRVPRNHKMILACADTRLVEYYRRKTTPAPPIVLKATGLDIVDGCHRTWAAVLRGEKTISFVRLSAPGAGKEKADAS